MGNFQLVSDSDHRDGTAIVCVCKDVVAAGSCRNRGLFSSNHGTKRVNLVSESVDSIEGSVSCAELQGCSITISDFGSSPFGYLTKVVLLLGQVEECQKKHLGCVESRQLSLEATWEDA